MSNPALVRCDDASPATREEGVVEPCRGLRAAVAVNGRPLLSSSPGIRRYVSELQRHLALPVLLPPERSLSGLRAHLWEQGRLPDRARGRLLFSPGNTGPLLHPRQVVTVHDLAPLDHPEFFAPAFAGWYRLLLAGLVRTCVRILVPSAFTARRLLHWFPDAADRTVVIPHGADHVGRLIRTPASEGRGRGGPPPDGPFVVTVGTREPRKNLRTVLEAWRILRRRGARDVRLLVIGAAGPRRVFARDDNPPDGVDGVDFLGAVDDVRLMDLCRRATAAVFVPYYEGFGLPILEAMACGTPVVASDIPVVREIAGDAVLRVDPRSPAALAEAVARLLEDGALRRRLGAAGRLRAGAFRWEETARRTAAVLSEVA